jgi:YidC/Oxa1 family membrane protein insertase
MMEIYNTILYEPLFNAVVFLYNIIPGSDFGLAIIALTIFIRILFFPLSVKTIQSQRALSRISPKVNEIKNKFKNDAQAQSAAIMQLYKEQKVNPFFGCLPLLIQLPILIALYSAFRSGFQPESLDYLYGFISNPGHIEPVSLGFLDISSRSIMLAVITGAFQYLQLKQNQSLTSSTQSDSGQSGPKEMQALNKQMLYFFPVMIIIIGWNLPAALLLYWLTTTIFSMLEQSYIKLKYKE